MPIRGDKFEFTDKNVNSSPEKHGVYALYQSEVLIYYGRDSGDGATIRNRLQSHLRGDEGSCTQGASHYECEPTEGPIAREKELLEEYRKQHGRLPRCNERVRLTRTRWPAAANCGRARDMKVANSVSLGAMS